MSAFEWKLWRVAIALATVWLLHVYFGAASERAWATFVAAFAACLAAIVASVLRATEGKP